MTRARVAILIFCAGLLVSASERPQGDSPAGASAGALVPHRVVRPASDPAPRIAAALQQKNPALSAKQLRRIAAAVVRYSRKYELDPELVTAVVLVESGARPWVRSPKGAVGLMQIMPHVAEPLALAGNLATIESNIEAGCLILADNIRRRGEEDGILSYFWGSQIRGVSYLERVREARASVRQQSTF